MNSAFVNPGIYSCAVDAFLEILLGMILQTCFSMLVHIICPREKTVHY